MKRTNWPVQDYGIRPAGKPDECFYCGEKKGNSHKTDCVIRSRTVVVEIKLNLIVSVPEDWTKENIEYKYNESGSCQSNILEEINDMADRVAAVNNSPCICGFIEASYIREATSEDEKSQQLFVDILPT